MKRFVLFGLVTILLLPLIAVGCTAQVTGQQIDTNSTVPPLDSGEEAKTIELTTDDFAVENHIVKDITITKPGSLIISLGANPTTGFSWMEDAAVSGNAMVQVSHEYVAPGTDENIVGAPGKDIWVFDSVEAGTAVITFDYSRPWEGEEQGTWTLTVNVTVR